MVEVGAALRFLLCLHLASSTSLAIGLSVGQCDDEIFKCQCGPRPERTVDVPVPQCTFFYKWKPYCHACKNGNRISPSDVCPKYRRCVTCNLDGESCSTCPAGKFGTFCDKDETASRGKSGLLDLNLSLGVLPGLGGGGGGGANRNPPPDTPGTVPECRCVNGGHCHGFDDFCTCPAGFRGTFCEVKTGCQPIPPIQPASVVRIPNQDPLYMEYSCPRTGYLLEGSPRLTCDKKTGLWSHPPPTCVIACQLPKPPVNGWLVNITSDTALIKAGQSVEFGCQEELVLIGPARTTCMADTNFSHQAPYCSKVTFCREPEQVVQSTYQLQVPPFQPPFTNGTKVVFSCTDGHLLMGQAQIICQDDGLWSSAGPTCVKVYDSLVGCETTGAQVVDAIGTPVRVHCPPDCAGKNETVWGTVIYEEESSVCRAAVHSGRISDALGGSLFVVNNGQYNDFLPSNMNGINSERKRLLSNSFRFHHDPSLEEQNQNDPDKGCPRGWTELSGHCIYVVAKKRAWNAAKGICTNMGSRLPSPRDPQFMKEVLRITGQHSDVESFWLISKSNSSESLPLWQQQAEEEEFILNPDIDIWTQEDEEKDFLDARRLDANSCVLVGNLSGDPLWTPTSCTDLSSFICDIDLSQFQVTCENLGELRNGLSQLQNPLRGFRRGAVLNFQCDLLHVLHGEASSTCLPDGTWSDPLPHCQRIPACLSPPTIKFGSFQILQPLPPVTNSRIAGRVPEKEMRRSRIGSAPPVRKTRQAEKSEKMQDDRSKEEIILPPGHHKVGSRASYTCESRYYNLVGSQTRRCQADGTWSGRPATCLPVCGRSDSPRTPFITGGNSSDIGQWPWQVGVAHALPGTDAHYLLCGGALINENWVLTAAHCVTDERTGEVLEPNQIRLYVGKYYRDDKRDDNFVQVKEGTEVHMHPEYDPNLYDADIALIRMDSYVTLTSRVQPVCLPTDKSTRQNLMDGRKGVVIGWGLTESSEYAESLRHAVLPVVSHERCEEGYEEAGMPLTVTENMYCAGLDEGKTDACSGDSGGPMVFLVDSGATKYWILEGVVSWGSLTGCGNPRQYGGFTKVNKFLDWISQYI